MSEEIDQSVVDTVSKKAKLKWDKLVEKSGKSELLFKISTDGMYFIAEYKTLISAIRARGGVIDDMFPDVSVNEVEDYE